MNERIKELAEQATITKGRMRVIDEQKFAELIVRKCANVADEYVRIGDIDIPELIRRNFGVTK